MRFLFVDVFLERIKFMIPLAIIASGLFGYLIFSKNGLFNSLENKAIKIGLKIISYSVIFFLSTMLLIFFGMLLLFGSLGLPVLFLLDILGIVLLIRRIFISRKNRKRADSEPKKKIIYMKA
ncbi:MAG: hypothetical protein FWG07_11890 [Treponema sp.]|nr:hypothetical protein [Treponema sp.]